MKAVTTISLLAGIKAACVSREVWDEKQASEIRVNYKPSPGASAWPNGRIYYTFDRSMKQDVIAIVKKAISEWNSKVAFCKWIEKVTDYSVVFKCWNKGKLRASQIGFKKQKNSICLDPEFRPEGLYMVDILHEMGHIAGLRHEFERSDQLKHLTERKGQPEDTKALGSYDYRSVMQYEFCKNCDWAFPISKNDEYEKLSKDTPTKTLSAGDLSALKHLYNPIKKGHHGEWHKPCKIGVCNAKFCSCGACGQLESGVNCGYWGMSGHWTCCMKEDYKDMECVSSHSGFWHAACVGRHCTRTVCCLCCCGNCGGGCTYEGTKGHWACCNKEEYSNKSCKASVRK